MNYHGIGYHFNFSFILVLPITSIESEDWVQILGFPMTSIESQDLVQILKTYFLECVVVYSNREVPKFRKVFLPPSSRLKMNAASIYIRHCSESYVSKYAARYFWNAHVRPACPCFIGYGNFPYNKLFPNNIKYLTQA